jgi:formamidase
MTVPIFGKDATPGDLLQVGHMQTIPRLNYGSNRAAHSGHRFTDFEK